LPFSVIEFPNNTDQWESSSNAFQSKHIKATLVPLLLLPSSSFFSLLSSLFFKGNQKAQKHKKEKQNKTKQKNISFHFISENNRAKQQQRQQQQQHDSLKVRVSIYHTTPRLSIC